MITVNRNSFHFSHFHRDHIMQGNRRIKRAQPMEPIAPFGANLQPKIDFRVRFGWNSHGEGHSKCPEKTSQLLSPLHGQRLCGVLTRPNRNPARQFSRTTNGEALMHKIILLLVALVACSVAQDAPMFRNNATHSGVYDAVGAPQLHGLRWKFKTEGQIYSTPALVDGILYFGSNDHNLYAVDASTGTQKWKFKTDARVTSSPAVANGIVFFESYDGNLYAVDAATGKQKWKFATGGEHRFTAPHLHGSLPITEKMPDPFDLYLSSPVVSNGIVYFGSGDTNIYALNSSDGSLKWKFQTGDVVHASPALADNTLYIGSWDSYFYALDAASGKLR